MPGPVIVPYYADVKDPAVDLIYFAAEQWASVSSWRLADGPGGEA